MTLASSGTISIGGSTANRSINLELSRSATATSSLGETSLRTLAGVSSGAISLSNFHGKSNFLDQQTVTVGTVTVGGLQSWGFYGGSTGFGSVSDGTCNFKSNANIKGISIKYGLWVYFILHGNHSNSGFTTMSISGTDYARTNANYSYISSLNLTSWRWIKASNPFGTTVGATKTVTWT